jgi:hypothetical protein
MGKKKKPEGFKDFTTMNMKVEVKYPIYNAEVIQVIRTELERRGTGAEGDPYRRIEQYWTLDGKLLFENDPYGKEKA